MLKDVTGIIKKITLPASKEFKVKSGPKAGKDFIVWSIGIQMIDNEWYNIKGDTQEKVTADLKSVQLNRNYQIGDEVKLFLEAEDNAGKYWKIISIVPHNPTDDVPVEEIDDKPHDNQVPGVTPGIIKEGILSVVSITGGIKIDDGNWINPNAKAKVQFANPVELKILQSTKGGKVKVTLDPNDQNKYSEITLTDVADGYDEIETESKQAIKPGEKKTDWDKKNQRDYRAMASAYSKDLVIGGKLELNKMKATAQEIYEFIWNGYAEDLPTKEG